MHVNFFATKQSCVCLKCTAKPPDFARHIILEILSPRIGLCNQCKTMSMVLISKHKIRFLLCNLQGDLDHFYCLRSILSRKLIFASQTCDLFIICLLLLIPTHIHPHTHTHTHTQYTSPTHPHTQAFLYLFKWI